MLYALLIYGSETVADGRTKEEEQAIIGRHYALRHDLEAQNKLGPAFRLMPTTNAVTVRHGKPVVLDGPFTETKEQLMGLYVIDCVNLDEVIAAAKRLGFESSKIEIRPVRTYIPASAA